MLYPDKIKHECPYFSFVIGIDSVAGFRVLLTEIWFDGLKESAGKMESLSYLGKRFVFIH